MLFLNDKIYDVTTDVNYKKMIADLEMGDLRFASRPFLLKNPRYAPKRNATGEWEIPKTSYFSWTSRLVGLVSMNLWRYTETPPTVDKNGKNVFHKSGEFYKTDLQIDEFNKEKLFYALYLSKEVQSGELVLYNAVNIAASKNEKRRDDSKLMDYIFSLRSVLNTEEEQNKNWETLRICAKTIGVTMADTKHIEVLKNEVYELCLSDKRIFEKFFREVSMTSNSGLKVAIQNAIDKKKIAFDIEKRCYVWVKNGVYGDAIYQIQPDDDPIEAFSYYLTFNKQLLAQLGGLPVDFKFELSNMEEIVALNDDDLKQACKERGIPLNGLFNRQRLEGKLINYVEEN